MVRQILISFAAIVIPAGAGAAPVAISNAGFEDLYFGSNLPAVYGGDVPTGTFPVGPPPAGWTPYYEFGSPPAGANIGVLNPGVAADYAPDPPFFTFGAPEGDNAVLLYTNGDAGGAEYGVEQTLAPVLEPNTTYTLSVEVGNIGSGTALLEPFASFGFFDIDGFPGYRIQLLAGGAMVAEVVDAVLPGERLWETSTLVFTTADSHPQMGQALGVRVANRNNPDVPGVTGIEVDFDDVRLDASAVPAVPLEHGAWIAVLLAALGASQARRLKGRGAKHA